MSRRATSKEKTRPTAVAAAAVVGSLKNQQSSFQFSATSTATAAQEQIILDALRSGPKTTCQLRACGVYQVSARLWHLRAKGWEITTDLFTGYAADGLKHSRMGLYTLVAEPEARS